MCFKLKCQRTRVFQHNSSKADHFDLADVDLRGTQVPIYSQVQMKQ